jgi:cell division protein FtsI (penicillin-binding protein 3)
MMKLVTLEGGTGVNAAPEGYAVAGKTGTAQVLEPQTKHYSANKYTSVFTGFVPADRPRLAITVVIHEPHGAIYGGIVAAPAFRNIAAKALPYLGVLPAAGEGSKPGQLPKGLKTASAETQKQGSGSGAEKARNAGSPAAPQKGAEKDKACTVSQQTMQNVDKEKASARMPNVSGMNLKTALQRLAPLGVQTKVQGSGRVVGQHPAGGSPLLPNSTVQLVLNETRETP